MKVFLLAYARKNLGDDLFIKMLLDRYPNVDFYIKASTEEHFIWFNMKYQNLTVLIGEDTDEALYNTDVTDYDGKNSYESDRPIYQKNFIILCKDAMKKVFRLCM